MPIRETPVVDLEIVAGQDFRHAYRWEDLDGNPIDLTGSALKMAIKESDDVETALVELTVDNGRVEIFSLESAQASADAPSFELFIPRAVTATFEPGARHVQDLIRIFAGEHAPVWRGEAVILAGRTT